MHKSLVNEESGLNYQFLICHILHHHAKESKTIINYLLEDSRDNLNFDNLNQLSLNLSLLVSCFEPVANLKYTTHHILNDISKLNKPFCLDNYFYDEDKENKLFISRGLDEEEDEDEK